MAKFSISLTVEVEAEDYDAAFEIERSVHEFIQGHDEVLGVYGIDVEQTSDLDEEDDGQEGELGENEEDIGAGAETAIEIGVMSSLDRPGQDRSRSESTIASTVFDYSSTTTSTVTFNVTDEAPKSVKKPRGSRRSLGGDGTFVTPPRDPNRIVIQTRSGNKY